MIKDIERPEVTDIAVAIVKEFDDEFQEENWNVYLLNLKPIAITGILVTSRGYGNIQDEKRESSTLRQFFEEIPARTYVKIEPIMEELFVLNNEFWVSFYIDKIIYDKKFIFLAESICEKNFTSIPLLNKPGVMIK